MKRFKTFAWMCVCTFALFIAVPNLASAQGQGQGQGKGLINQTGLSNGQGFTQGQGHLNGNSQVSSMLGCTDPCAQQAMQDIIDFIVASPGRIFLGSTLHADCTFTVEWRTIKGCITRTYEPGSTCGTATWISGTFDPTCQ